ncbi:MAG: hypothetical protein FDW93_03470 [Bergeyella sp.]|nr:hypothetical protein [Bergeyella sp.]
MEVFRNTIGVLVGLLVAGVIIGLGIRIEAGDPGGCFFSPYNTWWEFLMSRKDDSGFFVYLLFLSGISATIGGVATAFIVKRAKVAYAILIGFILLFIALIDIIIVPYHPTFYKLCIFLTFFPFSWLGGKLTEVLFDRKKSRTEESHSR